MATDNFKGFTTDLDAPANSAIAVTASDSVDLANVSRGIYFGIGGDLKVNMLGGQTVTFVAVPQGTLLPVRATRVWATGTSAASLLAVW